MGFIKLHGLLLNSDENLTSDTYVFQTKIRDETVNFVLLYNMHLLEINRTRDVSLIDLLQIYITTSTTMSYQNSPDMFLMDLGDGIDDIAMNLSPEEPPDIANLTPSQQSDTPVTPHVWSATSLHNVSATAHNCSADGYFLFPSQRIPLQHHRQSYKPIFE